MLKVCGGPWTPLFVRLIIHWWRGVVDDTPLQNDGSALLRILLESTSSHNITKNLKDIDEFMVSISNASVPSLSEVY
jgi:hypothetical protein